MTDRAVIIRKTRAWKWCLCRLGLKMIECQKYMQKTLTFSDSLFKLDPLFDFTTSHRSKFKHAAWPRFDPKLFLCIVWHFQHKAVFSCLHSPPLAGPSTGGKHYQDVWITCRYSHIVPLQRSWKKYVTHEFCQWSQRLLFRWRLRD